MMTRLSVDAIEYQFMFLPKSSTSEDFTLIPWGVDAQGLWNQLRYIVEKDDTRDVSFFDKDPWQTFGIADKTVQSRIRSEKSAAIVTGILKCSLDTGASSKEQVREYLKLEPEDSPYDWILDAIMAEPLPTHFSRHVSDGSVYWVDGRTGLSTWAHPLYGKYRSMLEKAREARPLTDAKSVAVFQLGCISHPDESLENISELARIFAVDLKHEPFLVAPIKKTLHHMSAVGSVSLHTVDDFRYMVAQRRAEYTSLERTLSLQIAKTKCIECEERSASIYCSDCGDFFCQECFAYIHSTGSRKLSHKRTQVELQECSDCEVLVAVLSCSDCKDAYCLVCFEKFHSRGGRRNHVPAIIKRGPALAPDDSRNRRKFEAMKSLWIRATDSGGVTFYNLATLESRRDLPLSLVNE